MIPSKEEMDISLPPFTNEQLPAISLYLSEHRTRGSTPPMQRDSFLGRRNGSGLPKIEERLVGQAVCFGLLPKDATIIDLTDRVRDLMAKEYVLRHLKAQGYLWADATYLDVSPWTVARAMDEGHWKVFDVFGNEIHNEIMVRTHPPRDALKFPKGILPFSKDEFWSTVGQEIERQVRMVRGGSLDEKLLKEFQTFLRCHEAETAKQSGLKIVYDIKGPQSTGLVFKENFMDGSLVIALDHPDAEDYYAAAMSFDCVRGGILIKQIQGTKGCNEILKHSKWASILLDHALTWAKGCGLRRVYIQGVQNNRWANKTYVQLKEVGIYPADLGFDGACKLSGENANLVERQALALIEDLTKRFGYAPNFCPHKAYVRYDVFAQRSGFTKTDSGDWVRDLWYARGCLK